MGLGLEPRLFFGALGLIVVHNFLGFCFPLLFLLRDALAGAGGLDTGFGRFLRYATKKAFPLSSHRHNTTAANGDDGRASDDGQHGVEQSVDNGRGNAALRKLGAVQEGILRQSFLRNGRYLDQALWAILPEDRVRSKAVWGAKIC